MSFEKYLQEQHAEDYHGCDDDMPDAFEHWMSERDVQEIVDYAEAWGETLKK